MPCTSSWGSSDSHVKGEAACERQGEPSRAPLPGEGREPIAQAPAPWPPPREPHAGAMAGAGELLRMIQDLRDTVGELKQNYKERRLPVTDGSRELHGLCAQLEFLLQFDLKEKRSFFGQRRDYWDFLCHGLASRRQGHEGVRFVSSLEKLRTPVGKGRAFIRYCLVHRQLAETLQLCFLDPQMTSDWYYARSPFLHPQLRADITGCLYELDGVTFHLALKRADLDAAWPMFSETLSRSSSQSPVTSQKEGPAWPVGNPAGDSEKHHGARRGPQEERQLPGQDSRSPGLSTDDPFQPGLEESREQSQDNGRQAGSQQRGSEAAADGKPEAELQRVNAQLQLQVEALGRELESTLVARLQQEAAQRCSSQAEELAELEARHGARLAEAEKRQQELAERLSQATRDAEQEAQAAAEALEEAERRLRAQEAERREYLAGAEAQELRHQQLLSRCQRLQEKLSASERRLEETEAQVAALQSQGQREGPSGSPPLGPEEETAQRVALEARLRQAELQAEGLREKLERGLAEGRELEREREALLESAVSQGQSLAAARLQAQDLQKELAAQRERNASLQAKLEHAGRALMDKEEGARGLQEELEGQSAKLRDALAENAAVASRLAEAGAGFASEKAQLEARGTEERAGHERAVAELRRRLAECEEQRRAEREEKQQLQAVLTEKDAWEQTLARAAAELERAGGGDRPEAGDEEPLGLARGRGAAEEKAAGGAGPQTDKQVLAGEPPEDLGTAARPEQKPRKSVEEMVKHLTTHLEKAMGEAQQKGQLLTAKEEEAKHLAEQLGRAQQDGERFRLALERAQREAEEREKKHAGQLAEQQELVREVKGRLLELLR